MALRKITQEYDTKLDGRNTEKNAITAGGITALHGTESGQVEIPLP